MMPVARHVTAAILVAIAALPARAHLVETGFGAFYNGFAHVALTASDLLVVLALALLAGQRGTEAARWSLLALPVAWIAGGLAGMTLGLDATLPVLTTLSFGVAGALVALRMQAPSAVIATYAALVGGVHGIANAATLAAGGAGSLVIAGAACAVFCVFAITSAQVTVLRAGWTSIAVRVVGSWVAAAAILMIGWQARLSG
jgi:urease accessory protein